MWQNTLVYINLLFNLNVYKTRIFYLVATLFSSKKEVTAVAGITQNKPTSTVEGSKNGVSCTPINGPIISATIKAANGTNMTQKIRQVVTSSTSTTNTTSTTSSTATTTIRTRVTTASTTKTTTSK